MNAYQERALAEEVAQACRVLGAFNMMHGATGHVSCRLPDDTILIKGKGPKQVGLRYTRPRDIIKVNFDADLVEGPPGLQPPSESFIHIWVYKLRPDVQCVVHAHPEYSVLIGVTGKEIVPAYGPYRPGATIARDGVPVYPDHRTVTTAEQGKAFAECMGNRDVALMVGHGISAAGDCIERASINALALETMCRTMFQAYALGGPPNALAPGALGEPGSKPSNEPRPRGSAGGEIGLQAGWRYWVSRAEELLGNRTEPADG